MHSEHYAGEELGIGRPTCPVCGSENGTLGTSYAYFICHEPRCPGSGVDRGYSLSNIVYWLGDGRHPQEQGKTWDDAIKASPWGKARQEAERK